jgi:hypothetical protein
VERTGRLAPALLRNCHGGPPFITTLGRSGVERRLNIGMSIFDKGFLTILGCSALLILVAIPLAMRKIPRNVAYGFRTRATMVDDHIWFEANAYFGRALIGSSLCGAFVAYLIYVLQLFPPAVFLPVSILVLVSPSLVAAVATARYVRSLGRSS